jgi:hypothetical protein
MDLKNITKIHIRLNMIWMLKKSTQTTLSPGESWLSRDELNQTLIVMNKKRAFHLIRILLTGALLGIRSSLFESRVPVVWIALMEIFGTGTNLMEEQPDHGAQPNVILVQNMPKRDILRRHQRLCPRSHFTKISHFQGYHSLQLLDRRLLQGILPPWNLKIRRKIPTIRHPLEARYPKFANYIWLKTRTARKKCLRPRNVYLLQDLAALLCLQNLNKLRRLTENCLQEPRHHK